MPMIYVGGFIFTASHDQAFQGPLAKPGVHLLDYYKLRVLLPWEPKRVRLG